MKSPGRTPAWMPAVIHASRAFGSGSRRSPLRGRAVLAAGVAAVLVSGCGAAGTGTADKNTAPRVRISNRLRAQEAAVHREVLASLHHVGKSHARYGGLPADLRGKQAAPSNQVLTGSRAHPAIAIQGNSVLLHVAGGTALATAVGPDIPDRIQGTADLHTPATWDLTFTDVRGTVPIAPSLFTITDEQGQLLSPHVRLLSGGPAPKLAPHGHPLTLQLSTVVSVGDGKLRYAPDRGPWLAEWDFDVETD